jgi:hypothetical protein
MKCGAARDRLLSYLDGEIPLEEEEQVTAHLGVCAGCRSEESALRETEAALRSLAEIGAAPDLAADLRRRIASEGKRRSAWRWAYVPAAAAAAAAAIFLLAHPRTTHLPDLQKQVSAVVKAQPQPAAPAVTAPVVKEVVSRPEGAKPRQVVQRPKRTSLSAPERIVPSPAPAETEAPALVQAPASEGTPSEVQMQAHGPNQMEEPETAGIVLVVGNPRRPAAQSSYMAEVTLPGGGKTVMERVIEHSDDGRLSAIRIALKQFDAETPPVDIGG